MDVKNLSIGKNPTEGQVNVVVEIPKGSNIKYELDKDSGAVTVDRFLHTSMEFPCNYGFVPNTFADDGDPLDVLVLSEHAVQAGAVIPAIVIGMLEMEDESGIDAKILAVPPVKIDPLYGEITMETIPGAIKNKIKHFFENYKTLEPGKWVKVKDWKGKEEALKTVQQAISANK